MIESFHDLEIPRPFLLLLPFFGETEDFRMWVCDLTLSLLAADLGGNVIVW